MGKGGCRGADLTEPDRGAVGDRRVAGVDAAGRSGLRRAVGVVVAFSVGLAVAWSLQPRPPGSPTAVLDPTATTGSTPQSAPSADRQGRAPAASAPTARAAVEAFLAAEVADDFDRSFSHLATSEQDAYAGPADWREAHGHMPDITGFRVVADDPVTTALTLRSVLDPVLGLVPARATVVWRVTGGDDGWGVMYAESDFQALYPPEAGAADAAAAWARDRRACQPAEPVLVGALSLADDLCGATGEIRVALPAHVTDDASAAALVDAFGPEALDWARVVRLRSPTPMDVLLAPVADTWTVIGATPVWPTP